MKFNSLLFFFFCASVLSAQQTGALLFDGVDDFATINFSSSTPELTLQNQTFKIIFKAFPTNGNQVLISQESSAGLDLTVGINTDGIFYISHGSTNHAIQSGPLDDGQCHEVALSFDRGKLIAYIDAVQYELEETNFTGFNSSAPFYLGSTAGLTNFFLGSIEDIAWRNTSSNQTEINSTYLKPGVLQDSVRVAYFSFWNFSDSLTTDPFNGGNICKLGGDMMISSFQPQYTISTCVEEWPLPESVGGHVCDLYIPSGYLVAPAQAPSNSQELIFNGSFEEFCTGLYGPQMIGTLPEHAFYSTSTGSIPTPYSKSDVAAWYTSDVNINSVDFFVRNGLGNIPSTSYVGFGHPGNTWNGIGDAIVGFTQLPNSPPEFIQQTPVSTLQNNQTYVLTLWAYTASPSTGRGGSLYLSLIDQNNSETTLLNYIPTIPNSSISDNNGWQLIQKQFTVPASGNFTTVRIGSNTGLQLGLDSYIFIDDISIKEGTHDNWPQWIGTTPLPDYFDYKVLVDSDGFVYITGNQQNGPIESHFGIPEISTHQNSTPNYGYFIAKYDSDGSLIWTEDFYYLNVSDVKLSSNGYLVIVGQSADVDSTNNLFYEYGSVYGQDYINQVNSGTISNNAFIQTVNCQNGNSKIYVYASPCSETFSDLIVDPISNDAHILYHRNQCATSTNFGSTTLPQQCIAIGSISSSGSFQPNSVSPFLQGNIKHFEIVSGFYYFLEQWLLSKYNSSFYLQNSISLNDAQELYSDVLGNLYVLSNLNQTHNTITEFNSNLTALWNFNTQSIFGTSDGVIYNVALSPNDVIIGGFADAPGCNMCQGDLWFAHLDAHTGTNSGWIKQSSQTDASMHGSLGIEFIDGTYDRIIFASGFVPSNSTWDIVLDNDIMSGSGTYAPNPDKNIVVSELKDIQSGIPRFKRDLRNSTLAFPNPVSNELNIETDSMIQRVEIADVTGNVLLEVSDVNSNRMILYLDKIQHDGIYFLKVETIKGIEVVKLKRNNN